MKLINKIVGGTHPKGLFFCPECETEVTTHYYTGLKASVCTDCRYNIRHAKENLCDLSKHKHLRDEGYHSPLYGVWRTMRDRCHNPNATSFHKYGAKGIKVCDEWRESFVDFAEWMLDNGYDPLRTRGPFKHRHSIDRIDSKKDYVPGNCRILTVGDNSREANAAKLRAVHAYRADTGYYVASYSSLTEASRALGISIKHMPELLDKTSNRNQANGYMLSTDKMDTMTVPKNTRNTSSFEAFNSDGSSVGIYSTKKEVAEKYDLVISNISKVLNGKRKHTKGFTFKYL